MRKMFVEMYLMVYMWAMSDMFPAGMYMNIHIQAVVFATVFPE